VIGGVAGGLAEYTGIDALLWRVGAIALTVAGGSGIIIYALLWLLMPAGPPVQSSGAAVERVRTGPRSAVPGVTVAALLMLAGVAVLIAQFTDWHLSGRGFFGTALLVVGIGLSVAALTGAGRAAKGGLIAVGIVLALGLTASATVHLDADHRRDIGDRAYRPETAAGVQPVYHGGLGDLTLDLTRVDLSGRSVALATSIDAGIGNVDVLVPPEADVQVTIDTGIGDVEVFGEKNTDGLYPGDGSTSWSNDGSPDIELKVSAGVGDVEVSRG
jgi:phage shock protein PspC (stress-responsive transcriptional regulator)